MRVLLAIATAVGFRYVLPIFIVIASWLVPLGPAYAAQHGPVPVGDSPSDTLVDTILALEKRYKAALLADDQKAFGSLLAEDLVYIWRKGTISNKAEVLEPFMKTEWRTKQYEPWNVKIRTFGSVAVVTMRLDRVWVDPSGKYADAFAMTRVWSQSNGVWRVSTGHVTEVPAPQGSPAAHLPADTAATQPLSAEVQAILAMEERYKAGLLAHDEETFRELLADDLIHIGSEGEIVDKAQYMDFFTRGEWWYKKYKPVGVRVRTYGSVAVVTGRVDRILQANDEEIAGALTFTHVWRYSDAAWRVWSSHVATVND
jgi:hypothetical protein